jgi:hypothetical protein
VAVSEKCEKEEEVEVMAVGSSTYGNAPLLLAKKQKHAVGCGGVIVSVFVFAKAAVAANSPLDSKAASIG